MSIPTDFPVTTDILLDTIDSLHLPSPLRLALFGLDENARSNLKADSTSMPGMAHLVDAPRALLARFLTSLEGLFIPTSFPTVKEFIDKLRDAFPDLIEFENIGPYLGREKSSASRWYSGKNQTAYPAVMALMALVTANPSETRRRWEALREIAILEAGLRCRAPFDGEQSWGPKLQPWIPARHTTAT